MTQALDTEQSADGTPTGSSDPDAQALIREARARQRKRRLGFGVAVMLVAAVGISFGTGGFSSGGPGSSTVGPSGPVVARAGLARITFTSRDTRVGGCTPVSTGTGSIDLRNHAIAYVVRGVAPEAVGAFTGCGFGSSMGAGRWLGTTSYTAGQGMPWKKVSSGARSWKAVSAIEPLYTGIYATGGGDTENAVEVPAMALGLEGGRFTPSSQHPLAHTKLVELQTLRQQHAFEMTLTLSSYGVAPTIAAP